VGGELVDNFFRVIADSGDPELIGTHIEMAFDNDELPRFGGVFDLVEELFRSNEPQLARKDLGQDEWAAVRTTEGFDLLQLEVPFLLPDSNGQWSYWALFLFPLLLLLRWR
jgi:hypothetical protein